MKNKKQGKTPDCQERAELSDYRCQKSGYRWIKSVCQWLDSVYRWLHSYYRWINSVYRWVSSDYRWINVACTVTFVLFAACLMAICNYNYLRKVEDLSLFLPTWLFLKETMQVPGGGLIWCGTFLTQFFYHPWLGTGLFVALLTGLQYLVKRAFHIPNRYSPLSFIPSALLLLSLLQLGYVVYVLKSPGYAFSNVLGMLAVTGAFWVYRNLSGWPFRSVFVVLFVVVGYPLLGFYALLSAGLFAIDEWMQKRFRWPLIIGLIIACIALIPLFYYILLYTQLMCDSLYTSCLPRFSPEEINTLWMPFLILFVFVVLLAFHTHCWKSQFFCRKEQPLRDKEQSPHRTKQSSYRHVGNVFVHCSKEQPPRLKVRNTLSSMLLFIAVLAGVACYECDDENFRIAIDMDRAIMENDWQKAVDYAAAQKGEPTRLVVLNTDLALYKLGEAGDRMFKFKINGVPYEITRPAPVMRCTGAKALYYQYGKINYCYRWCMEDKVEYGMKVEYLKYMVKCALLNGEFPLAQKYNTALSQTLFHKDWAAKYQRYIDYPELMAEDAEFKAIKPLMAYNNALEGDGGLLEAYLVSQIAYMEGGPPELVELSLQCTLIQKDIQRFWPRFMLYARTHERLPLHYQQAAILYSYLEQKVDYRRFKLDSGVIGQFNKFISMSEQMAGQSEEKSKEVFKLYFGDTFWYYYFFVKGLKTS